MNRIPKQLAHRSALSDRLPRVETVLERILIADGGPRTRRAAVHPAAPFSRNRRRPAGGHSDVLLQKMASNPSKDA